jgi:hemerythrin
MYEMKEEYYTGIAQIDNEHKRLFELAEEAYQLLHDEYRHDKYDELVAILQELEDYTKTHFQHEEEYMASIDYPAIFIQKAQHKAFIEKLESIDYEEMDDNQEQSIADILDFLTDWLVNHILKMDKLIAEK